MWAIFECDKIRRGQPPQNERDTGQRFRNSNAAWAAVRALQRQNPDKSYVLGMID